METFLIYIGNYRDHGYNQQKQTYSIFLKHMHIIPGRTIAMDGIGLRKPEKLKNLRDVAMKQKEAMDLKSIEVTPPITNLMQKEAT